MQSNQIPNKFAIPFGNSAAAGTIRPVPQASQSSVTPGAASLADGFPAITGQPLASGGVPPSLQDFNGLFNQITAWNRWQNAGGTVLYDATFSASIGGYPMGAVLGSSTSGVLWLSTAENNTTNPDSPSAAGWVNVLTPGSITTVYAKGSLITRRVFSAPGTVTYTPTSGTNRVRVTVVGGGGSGTGVPTTTASQFAVGAGGGAGGVAISDIASGFSGVALTVGAGGAKGPVGTAGNNGGTSSFGTLLSATGGAGGTVTGASSNAYSNAGGVGGNGTSGNVFNGNGGAGANGVAFSNSNISGGAGGPSYVGAGASAVYTGSLPGSDATTAGSGGGGAVSQASGTGYLGGAGANGIVIVEEYS